MSSNIAPKTLFDRSGNNYTPTNAKSVDLVPKLPVGTYTITTPAMGPWYLTEIDDLNTSGKLYGKTTAHTERVLNTFADRPATTGVMLVGEKGSGKSLLAKSISCEGRKKGYSTVVINRPLCGEQFNKFIQMLEDPTIIIFDEFEKVYDSKEQEAILTLLDGTYPSKKLFVFTCNNQFRVDYHMRNRPGRIYYLIEFASIESEFIEEYCDDNLKNLDYKKDVVNISSMFTNFNFDMLKAMVEEMNRYNESPAEVVKLLNTKLEYEAGREYTVSMKNQENVDIDSKMLEQNSWTGNALTDRMNIDFRIEYTDDDGDIDTKWACTPMFGPTNLVEITRSGQYIYRNEEGVELTLTPKVKAVTASAFSKFSPY